MIKIFNNATGKWDNLTGAPGATITIDTTGNWAATGGLKTLIGTIRHAKLE